MAEITLDEWEVTGDSREDDMKLPALKTDLGVTGPASWTAKSVPILPDLTALVIASTGGDTPVPVEEVEGDPDTLHVQLDTLKTLLPAHVTPGGTISGFTHPQADGTNALVFLLSTGA